MITFGGAEIYIGLPPAAVSFGAEVGLEDFDGVTWELVDGLYNIGEINSEQLINEFEVIGSDWMRKVKSTRNSGSMLNQFVPDGLDPGQLRMASAAGNCRAYPIRVVYKGACDGGDIFYPSGETVLFYATVSEGVISGGGKGELLLKSWQLNITTNIVRYYPTVFFGEAKLFSDFAQDDVGGIPVTDVEQPIGYWANKSGNNFALKQVIPGERPKISSRINRVVSDTGSNFVVSPGLTITQTTKGGGVALELINTAGTVNQAARAPDLTPGDDYNSITIVSSVRLYAGTENTARLGIGTLAGVTVSWGGANASVISNTGPGTYVLDPVGSVLVSGLDSDNPTTIKMQRVFPLGIATEGALLMYFYPGDRTPAPSAGASIVIQGLDVRTISDNGYPSPQRVSGESDYDKVGFPQFVRFDGADDALGMYLQPGDYTVAIGTMEGTHFDEITHAGGELSIKPSGAALGHNRVVGVVIREGHMTPLQKSDVIEHFRQVSGKGELV